MDNRLESVTLISEIKLNDRKKVSLSGLKKLVSFDPEEFVMDTNLGPLVLKGSFTIKTSFTMKWTALEKDRNSYSRTIGYIHFTNFIKSCHFYASLLSICVTRSLISCVRPLFQKLVPI